MTSEGNTWLEKGSGNWHLHAFNCDVTGSLDKERERKRERERETKRDGEREVDKIYQDVEACVILVY